MFVEKLYDEIRLYMNQGQSQYYNPNEVMVALNRAQIDKYAKDYRPYEERQKLTDSMRNFKKTEDIGINGENTFDLPDNYFNVTNISSLLPDPLSTQENPLPDLEYSGKIYTDGEWLVAASSELLPPLDTNIKARIIAGAVQILPLSVPKIRLYYLKKPADAIYAFDTEFDKIIFKEQGSVDPEFPETEHSDLIQRTLVYLGISQRAEVLIKTEKILNE